ncbi:MinD/ParA family protein [Desulfovibrio sp. OttesenSCG-928-O18]|nr:MinD/ParA family protein [Desulfovibrio sp. OttesenSCG-928-O18]
MTEHGTLSIAIVSGKGGVGKTNIALNLAYALHRAKQRVLLMDCDLGLANLDVLLGIAPKISVEQVMLGEATLAEAAVSIEPGGFSLIPASSGIDALGDSTSPMHMSFLNQLNAFAGGYEYLLLDVGAGITDSVQSFAVKAAMRLVVVTPEPTSLTDAYALIKVLASQHGITDFHVLVNQAESTQEEKASFTRLAAACEKFLGLTLHSLGGVRYDPTMIQAVRRQEPLLKFSPSSPAGKDLISAAVRVHKMRETLELEPGKPLKTTDGQVAVASC